MIDEDVENISAMLNRTSVKAQVSIRFGKEHVACSVDELRSAFAQVRLFRKLRPLLTPEQRAAIGQA